MPLLGIAFEIDTNMVREKWAPGKGFDGKEKEEHGNMSRQMMNRREIDKDRSRVKRSETVGGVEVYDGAMKF